ncbi:hypothetical protein F5Y15DRAFT_430522 [Xylariaceae sp. FL0016]|nr:hypothetical protein F5Y15DRAFT_430522 [Xylariaceae sp. FL0016]
MEDYLRLLDAQDDEVFDFDGLFSSSTSAGNPTPTENTTAESTSSQQSVQSHSPTRTQGTPAADLSCLEQAIQFEYLDLDGAGLVFNRTNHTETQLTPAQTFQSEHGSSTHQAYPGGNVCQNALDEPTIPPYISQPLDFLPTPTTEQLQNTSSHNSSSGPPPPLSTDTQLVYFNDPLTSVNGPNLSLFAPDINQHQQNAPYVSQQQQYQTGPQAYDTQQHLAQQPQQGPQIYRLQQYEQPQQGGQIYGLQQYQQELQPAQEPHVLSAPQPVHHPRLEYAPHMHIAQQDGSHQHYQPAPHVDGALLNDSHRQPQPMLQMTNAQHYRISLYGQPAGIFAQGPIVTPQQPLPSVPHQGRYDTGVPLPFGASITTWNAPPSVLSSSTGTSSSSESSPMGPQQDSPGVPDQRLRRTRLTKSCDQCRRRHRRCEEQRPCQECTDNQLVCTDNYLSRRRGRIPRVPQRNPENRRDGSTEEPNLGI